MIEKTEAVTLRVVPFSETSHMVTWLTPDYGKLTTVIKGAMRPKSPFLGQYDLFYTCELLFYLRSRGGVHIARECAPILPRKWIRTCWQSSVCASYLCDLLARVSLEHADQTDVYMLATETLDFLASKQPREALVFWFELRLLQAIGLSPRLDSCTVCRASVPQTETVPFSHQNGGIVCRSCRSRSISTSTILTPDVRATLNAWGKASSPRVAHNTLCYPQQHLAFCELFDIMFDHLGGNNTVRRQVLLDTLSFDLGGTGRSKV